METVIKIDGKQDDVSGYTRFRQAVVEHWDKFTCVRTGWNDKRSRSGRLAKSDFEKSLADGERPNTNWLFELTTEDEEFAVWFKMRYF